MADSSLPVVDPITASAEADNGEAISFLSSLLGKTLRIQIKDRRMFVGQMKCTDKDRNIILANAHEYREPSAAAIAAAAVGSVNGKVTASMTSRYVGLIVCPGEHIERIELEEYIVPRSSK